MKILQTLKHYFFDKRNITLDLYRPLIYWLYFLTPFKRTGQVVFPSLDKMKAIINDLKIDTKEFFLNRSDLEKYMSNNIHEYWHYFSTGYGKAFVGKTAEHFVSLKLSNFRGGIYIDIAASESPFYKVVKKYYQETTVYQQDLVYENGIHGIKMGGNAAHLPVDDESVDFMTLHNSIEHFEGNADTGFIKECSRVLKPGGEVIILPIFLEKEAIQYINPTVNPKGFIKDKGIKSIYVYGHPRFMRHYSAATFKKRIIEPAQGKFNIKLFKIITSKNFNEDIELALALHLTKL